MNGEKFLNLMLWFATTFVSLIVSLEIVLGIDIINSLFASGSVELSIFGLVVFLLAGLDLVKLGQNVMDEI